MGVQQEAGGTGDHWDAANVEGGKGILVLELGAERKSGKSAAASVAGLG